ncbi:MAG TPA: DinB family protein [Bacteroidia bacterium]|nr:DinB family protein [Bacteroidia bacterium]
MKVWRTNRKLYDSYFDKFSNSQLNRIPEGFNNNLVWHIGHIIVAQQSLVYKSSNISMHIPESLYERYRSGTKPDGNCSDEEMKDLRSLLIGLVSLTEQDLAKGVFRSFNERTTGTGFHLASVQDALQFNNYHEGMHLGYMMSIRKFV